LSGQTAEALLEMSNLYYKKGEKEMVVWLLKKLIWRNFKWKEIEDLVKIKFGRGVLGKDIDDEE
jgi:hypothetical protein